MCSSTKAATRNRLAWPRVTFDTAAKLVPRNELAVRRKVVDDGTASWLLAGVYRLDENRTETIAVTSTKCVTPRNGEKCLTNASRYPTCFSGVWGPEVVPSDGVAAFYQLPWE